MELARLFWDEAKGQLVLMVSPREVQGILTAICEACDAVYSDGTVAVPVAIVKGSKAAALQLKGNGLPQVQDASTAEGGDSDANNGAAAAVSEAFVAAVPPQGSHSDVRARVSNGQQAEQDQEGVAHSPGVPPAPATGRKRTSRDSLFNK